MSRLLICHEGDIPSANMKKVLLGRSEWEDMGSDGRASYLRSGDLVMMTVDRMHIHAENADLQAKDYGIEIDDVVVLSRHSSASGKPTLTVHPIGNLDSDNSMGGLPRTLVRSAPHLMTGVLRRIAGMSDDPAYSVSFEVTHHGPYLSAPTMYLEIGSKESHWCDVHAAEVLVESLMTAEESSNPVVIGVGGGHYAPRFTELVLSNHVDVGHMVPNYRIEKASDEEVSKMISDAATASETDMVYIHRNSMKGPEERRINDIVDMLGLRRVSSRDLRSV